MPHLKIGVSNPIQHIAILNVISLQNVLVGLSNILQRPWKPYHIVCLFSNNDALIFYRWLTGQ